MLSAHDEADPVLSVIVTIVDGGESLRRTLLALAQQVAAPTTEVIVPYDASVAATIAAQTREFPGVRFLPIGVVTPGRPITSFAGQHELYDRRRAAGLAAAHGSLIAILEDRGAPRPDWAKTGAELHRQLPHAVIGGAVVHEPAGLLDQALFLCDFERFSPPFVSGPRAWISDINVIYKRRAIESVREIWRRRFHEPLVHWALAEQGETLFLASELVVVHRYPTSPPLSLLHQRVAWGRLFGHIRAKKLSLAQRLGLALISPALPILLVLRHGLAQARKGRLTRYAKVAAHVLLLTVFWTIGEVSGLLGRRP